MILLLALVACWSSGPVCPTPETTLATKGTETVACADVAPVHHDVELLGGRVLSSGESDALDGLLRSEFQADPDAARARIASAKQTADDLDAKVGLDAASARGTAAWEANAGESPLVKGDDDLGNLVRKVLSVWATEDGDRLLLAETDIEGLIRYASLCRQAQGGSALSISVANRVTLYDHVVKRFHDGSHDDRVAMLALGGMWWSARRRWLDATAEEQQAWIAAAPLPPPMTADSLGYFDAILNGDLVAHARELHLELGPLHLVPAGPDSENP